MENFIPCKDGNKIIIAETKATKRFKIFVDVDGVLAAWMKSACEACNLDINDKDLRNFIKEGNYLDKYNNLGDAAMWRLINDLGEDFWVNLELLPWAKKLYGEMSKLGEVCFLTSPSKHAETAAIASSGKVKWIDKHFKTTKWIIAYNKEFMASDDSILIDDSEEKIISFRKWGGHAFHWPNDLKLLDKDIDVDETINELIQIVNSLKGE